MHYIFIVLHVVDKEKPRTCLFYEAAFLNEARDSLILAAFFAGINVELHTYITPIQLCTTMALHVEVCQLAKSIRIAL